MTTTTTTPQGVPANAHILLSIPRCNRLLSRTGNDTPYPGSGHYAHKAQGDREIRRLKRELETAYYNNLQDGLL